MVNPSTPPPVTHGMRQEHDTERDIMFLIHSDNPIAKTEEFEIGGSKHVIHTDASGEVVRMEVHQFSKTIENASKTVRKEFKAESDARGTLGEFDWELSDGKSGDVLDKGHKVAMLCEVSIELLETTDKLQTSVSVPLAENIRFGLSSTIASTPEISGFALRGMRSDEKSFSWDWFNVDSPTHATKIQESGELAIEIVGEDSNWQIGRTEFLTDVSIRIARFDPTGSSEQSDPRDPEWRLLIKQGTTIHWPRLIDGAVIL